METATVDTTPVTTSSDASAAPATSAPSSSSTTSERPTDVRSLANFMAKLDTAAAPASNEATTPDGQPDATAPAVTAEQTGITPTEKKGPIPFDVHQKSMENARAKAADEAVAKYRETYGWAEQVPRETIQEWSGIASQMTSDPIGFLHRFSEQLASHPVYGPQLRSQAARTLSAGRGAADLSPDLVVDDGNGKQIATFSAERVQAIVNHAIAEAIQKEVGPLKQESLTARSEREAAQYVQSLHSAADGVMDEVHDILEVSPSTDGKYSADDMALFSAVNQAMVQNPTWTAQQAALAVWKAQIRPSIEAKALSKAVDQQKQKAAGNTASASGAGAAPKRPTSVKELAAYMERQASGA